VYLAIGRLSSAVTDERRLKPGLKEALIKNWGFSYVEPRTSISIKKL
jgi:hypothetical protein